MNIALLTFGDSNVAEWNSISFPNKEKYCQLHGYTFISETVKTSDRHPAWTKIDLLRKYIDNYDWIFWSDTDSLVMNFDFKLESLTQKNKNLILCESNGTICTGEFLIRSCDWAKYFLIEINKYDFSDYPWEQTAFEKVIKENNFFKYIKTCNERLFNSTPNIFELNDFIIHFKKDYKDINLFAKYANMIQTGEKYETFKSSNGSINDGSSKVSYGAK